MGIQLYVLLSGTGILVLLIVGRLKTMQPAGPDTMATIQLPPHTLFNKIYVLETLTAFLRYFVGFLGGMLRDIAQGKRKSSGTRVPGSKYPAGNTYYPYPNG